MKIRDKIRHMFVMNYRERFMVRKARKWLEKRGLRNEKISIFLNEKYKDDEKRGRVYDLMVELSRPPYHYLDLSHIGTSFLDGRPDNFFGVTHEGKRISTPSAIIFHDMNRLLTVVFLGIGSTLPFFYRLIYNLASMIYNNISNFFDWTVSL